jgi:hypothetical protein
LVGSELLQREIESDRQYFERRSDEEIRASDIAECPKAAIAHCELAARYAQLAAAIGALEIELTSDDGARNDSAEMIIHEGRAKI